MAAVVSRLWVYHRWYDDLLILLPRVTLFRIVKQGPSFDGSRIPAGLLLIITLLTMMAPGGLYLLPLPWNMRYVGFQAAVWLLMLMFLLIHGYREKRYMEE